MTGDHEWRAQIEAWPGGDFLLAGARHCLPDAPIRHVYSIVWRFLNARVHPAIALVAIARGITSPLNERAALRTLQQELGDCTHDRTH